MGKFASAYVIAEAKTVKVEVISKVPKFSEEIEVKVSELWKFALKKGRTNGTIFSYSSHRVESGDLYVEVMSVEYKYFNAQVENPSLGHLVKPVAVAGIIQDVAGNVLLGSRKNTTNYDGFWNFPPCGGLDVQDIKNDHINAENSLSREFCEETVIGPESISSVCPLALVYDENHGVYDILFLISLKNKFQQGHLLTEEYDLQKIGNLQEVKRFIKNKKVTPTVSTLCALLKNL
jgi:hypothetical protein